MTKYTIDSIAKYVREQSNGKCELLSTSYKALKYPLLFRCECGNTFERTLADMKKNNSFSCIECKKKRFSEKYRKNMDEVIKIIEDNGCEYVSGKYINFRSKLVLRCKCGNLFEKSLAGIQKGQNHCPKCGLDNLSKSKTKYTEKDAKEIVAKKGYTIIGKYVNASTPFKCVCKRGHEVNIILSQFLKGCSGCEICSHIENSGVNHYNYHGGTSKVLDYLRKSEKDWKKEILDIYDNKCVITGNTDVVVHHLISFRKLVDIACEKCGLEFKPTINQYTAEEYQKLTSSFKSLHSLDSGIVLSKEIHKRFHSEYGIRNNTPEQLEKFFKYHYNLNLNDVLKK